MKNIFNSIKISKPKRNYFDLTHDVKMSGKMGQIMPSLKVDFIPGDDFRINNDILVRFAPMFAPVMHRFDVTVHNFAVPYRILWPNWERFITGAAATLGGVDPVWPYINYDDSLPTGFLKLADYLGLPTPVPGAAPLQISALPFAAYTKIYADYYRDQNLDPAPATDVFPGTVLNDGDNTPQCTDWIMRHRAWEHDYFTAALPWAQKGPEVVIPFNQTDMKVGVNLAPVGFTTLDGTPFPAAAGSDESNNPELIDNELFARPNSPDSSPTIDDLRRAFKLKEWLEKNARGGTRYIESILMHFGVRSSDKRLQRPEYISGLKAPVSISEVLNTTGQVGGVPQGTMAGHGISASGGNTGHYFAEEHGVLIGLVTVLPKPAYQDGIEKEWIKNYAEDYFWPSFAHLGEQPIQNQELCAGTSEPYGTFGYIPRYSEYRYQRSRISGEFRTTLDTWHAGRIFDPMNPPVLNKDFIEVKPEDVNRIFNVTDPDEDTLFMHVVNSIGAKRPIPLYGTPTSL